jgi:hypothetical protein
MIFYNIPSVGQLKPDTLFGSDDHFGFIETLLGEEYNRNEIKEKCIKYYEKENDRYWDQIITLVNFFAIKKLDETNRFTEIPLLTFIADQYDSGNTIFSGILFDYLLCQWQFPHPILTKNREQIIEELELNTSNQRTEFPYSKPYSVILSILKELYLINPEYSYFTNEEFYWLGCEFYKIGGSGFNIQEAKKFSSSILEIRFNGGWNLYERIKHLDQTRTHLSYPKGFLKNSSLLTTDRKEYEEVGDFFIGLKRSEDILDLLENMVLLSNRIFEFDRSISINNNELNTKYSNFLYNPIYFKEWIANSKIYKKHVTDFDSIGDIITPTFDNYKKFKIARQLNRLNVLDKESIVRRRAEQFLLRRYIILNDTVGKCAICSKDYPVKFLATAHIKKRSECTHEEKKDFNVVMPACHFGCDKLYEEGYIIVNSGKVNSNLLRKSTTKAIEGFVNTLDNTDCSYYKEENKKYFEYHAKKNI